jgi:anti-sigma factor RsiW
MIALRSRKPLLCRELVELVTDYLEGTLSRRDRARFEEHIAGCPHCTEYLAQFRETLRLTGGLRESDVSPEAEAELLDIFASWKDEQQA